MKNRSPGIYANLDLDCLGDGGEGHSFGKASLVFPSQCSVWVYSSLEDSLVTLDNVSCCFLTLGVDHREKKYKAHRQFGDRRGGVVSARTYFYADEAKCDAQMETFLNCIKASGEHTIKMQWMHQFMPFF